MKNVTCPKCLSLANYICDGHDEDKRKFKLHKCLVCGSYIRDFLLTESETVDEIIKQESSVDPSANGIRAKPEQLPLFTVVMPLRYGD